MLAAPLRYRDADRLRSRKERQPRDGARRRLLRRAVLLRQHVSASSCRAHAATACRRWALAHARVDRRGAPGVKRWRERAARSDRGVRRIRTHSDERAAFALIADVIQSPFTALPGRT